MNVSQIMIDDTPKPISHNLVYQLFSMFTGQGKSSSTNIKDCFKSFCESIPPDFKLEDYKGQEF